MEKETVQDLIDRLNICVNAELCRNCKLNNTLKCMIARSNLKKVRDALVSAQKEIERLQAEAESKSRQD